MLKIIITRWKAPTPAKWKKTQQKLLAVGSALALLTTTPGIPEGVLKYVGYGASGCSFLSSLLIQFIKIDEKGKKPVKKAMPVHSL